MGEEVVKLGEINPGSFLYCDAVALHRLNVLVTINRDF